MTVRVLFKLGNVPGLYALKICMDVHSLPGSVDQSEYNPCLFCGHSSRYFKHVSSCLNLKYITDLSPKIRQGDCLIYCLLIITP